MFKLLCYPSCIVIPDNYYLTIYFQNVDGAEDVPQEVPQEEVVVQQQDAEQEDVNIIQQQEDVNIIQQQQQQLVDEVGEGHLNQQQEDEAVGLLEHEPPAQEELPAPGDIQAPDAQQDPLQVPDDFVPRVERCDEGIEEDMAEFIDGWEVFIGARETQGLLCVEYSYVSIHIDDGLTKRLCVLCYEYYLTRFTDVYRRDGLYRTVSHPHRRAHGRWPNLAGRRLNCDGCMRPLFLVMRSNVCGYCNISGP